MLSIAITAGCKHRGGGGGEEPVPGTPSPEPDSTGLDMTIRSASIDASRRLVVEFTLEDDQVRPLPLSALDGDPRFVFGWIATDPATRYTRYRSYVLRTVAGAPYDLGGVMVPPALASAQQAAVDSGGQFTEIGPGRYRYVSGTILPEGYDRGATHTVASYLSRDGRSSVDNEVFHFLPSGERPSVLREVVLTRSCNECHQDLSAHGGTRREIALCVVCHTDQTVDPESGENLELGRLVHRIHKGADLATLPFLVVGNSQGVHDFSGVRYPGDLRDCSKCHDGGAGGAAEFENAYTQPARASCGGCHDDVNFATGAGHNDGVAQFDDLACSTCHRPDLVEEFENSVPGAHVLPERSALNPGLTLQITGVSSLGPGLQPSVSFHIDDDLGPVDIATLDQVALVFAGPTSDYSQLVAPNRLTIQGNGAVPMLVVNGGGDYTFTPAGYQIPVGASGSWSVGMEARTGDINFSFLSFRFGANNPVVDIDVASGDLGGGSPQPRREVVDAAKCNRCHGALRVHGDLRAGVEYCVLCHHPLATDEAQRPGVDPLLNPPETVDFKVLIHRIHRGEELENDYTVYGSGGTPHDFTEVRYPRDLRDCDACHREGTEELPPSPGALATVLNIGGVPLPGPAAILTPTMAACLGCHDGDVAEAHARELSVINDATDWTENCVNCHGPGKGVDPALFHARD